eukprot:scaffold67233_cov17-Tisochrysis_lutea.AAC.1
MDVEAAARATTTYLVQRRIDMLPKPLTEDICSLRRPLHVEVHTGVHAKAQSADLLPASWKRHLLGEVDKVLNRSRGEDLMLFKVLVLYACCPRPQQRELARRGGVCAATGKASGYIPCHTNLLLCGGVQLGVERRCVPLVRGGEVVDSLPKSLRLLSPDSMVQVAWGRLAERP